MESEELKTLAAVLWDVIVPRPVKESTICDGTYVMVMARQQSDWTDLAFMAGDYEEVSEPPSNMQHRHGEIDGSKCTPDTLVLRGDKDGFHRIKAENIACVRRV
jgi:hypothetical protein